MTRRIAIAAVALLLLATTAAGQSPVTLAPGATTVVASGGLAFVVHAPADGAVPIVVAVFRYGGDVPPVPVPPVPPVPPTPTKVSGIWIIEEQADRTAAQAQVLDDPIWQVAALTKGLTYKIEDKDLPSLPVPIGEAVAEATLPVVCFVDGDGKPVSVVPLPDTVEDMRAMIGGVK